MPLPGIRRIVTLASLLLSTPALADSEELHRSPLQVPKPAPPKLRLPEVRSPQLQSPELDIEPLKIRPARPRLRLNPMPDFADDSVDEEEEAEEID
ncbi:MAG: hypothetical protein ACREQQ_08425 [Candidatus Binatia bacterium]